MKLLITSLFTALLSVNALADAEANGPSINLLSESEVDKILCAEGTTIPEHMQSMGFTIRKLSEMVHNMIVQHNPSVFKDTVLMDVQILRTHLTAVLPKTPTKIKNIDLANIQKNKIIFQGYILKMIGYTLDLEGELLENPVTPEGLKAQRIKVANLILKINDTVTEAHDLFRK